jgi:hypothetical protein
VNYRSTLYWCIWLATVFVAVGLCVHLASGTEIKLAWDAPVETNYSVTNYVLYAQTNLVSKTNYSVRQSVGTNQTATVQDIAPGRWWFAATAVAGGAESDLSNVVLAEVPVPPPNMRTVVVQYGGTLTNFYDVGFFRLRLP